MLENYAIFDTIFLVSHHQAKPHNNQNPIGTILVISTS